MSARFIQVRYKCLCMEAEKTINVPVRKSAEDLKTWMNQCFGPAIYLDHRVNSPTCVCTTMEFAKIPYDDGQPVGQPATRQ